MRQVRSSACKSGMSKTQWHASKICQLQRSSPCQLYRLFFITATTAQFVTSMAIACHEANHTCLPVASKLISEFSSRPSLPRPHRTWTQTASQPPTTTDLQFLISLLDTVKSFLSMFNIQNLCHTLRSLVLRVQKTSDRISKIMVVLDAIVICFSTSINHDLRLVVWNDISVTPKNRN